MKSLFTPEENALMISRIRGIEAGMPAQWGKMNASQMFAHCTVPLVSALNEVQLKRSFGAKLASFLFGKVARRQIFSPVPFKKNLPTDGNFKITDPREFRNEQESLVGAIKRFGEKKESGIPNKKHPFFGHLSDEEWGQLMWKHLDHHLRQFGA